MCKKKDRAQYIQDRLSQVKNPQTEKHRIAKEMYISWHTVHRDSKKKID